MDKQILTKYYNVLQLPEGSNLQEIRSAYRKLVLKYHPDTHGDSYKEQFLELQKAYETLIAHHKNKTTIHSNQKINHTPEPKSTPKYTPPSSPKSTHKVEYVHYKKPSQSPHELTLEKMRLAFKSKNFLLTKELANQLIKIHKHKGEAYSNLAEIARYQGEIKTATQFYYLATQADPHNSEYQKKYQTLKKITQSRPELESEEIPAINETTVHLLYIFVIMMCFLYLSLSKETSITQYWMISQWTIGLISMLCLSGVAFGIWASLLKDQIHHFEKKHWITLGAFPFWIGVLFHYNSLPKSKLGILLGTLIFLSASFLFKNPMGILQTITLGGNLMIWGGWVGYKIMQTYQSSFLGVEA